MAKINRVNGNVQAFASSALGTERTIFGEVTQSNDLTAQFTPDFLRGWGIVGPSDQPSLEDFNGAMYTHGQLLAYLHQMGIAEYNSGQEYHLNSVTQFGGVIYVSLQNNNTGNAPDVSPASWKSPVSSGALIAIRTITASGTYTPTAGTKKYRARLIGGGGSGSGAAATNASQVSVGGGGASGSCLDIWVTNPAAIAVVVGAGGIGVAGSTGGNGGATTIGAIATAPGGLSGGSVIVASTATYNGGQPGVTGALPTTSATLISAARGQPGTLGIIMNGFVFSGNGGSGPDGGGGSGTTSGPGVAGNGPGSGGAGASSPPSSSATAGASGAPGIIQIWEYA